LKVAQWFLLTTPSNFKDRIAGIKDLLGVSDRTVQRLTRLIEAETGHQIEELNIDFIGPKIPHVQEVTIIHSRSDKVIPVEDARRAHQAIPQSTLIELEGLGHYRILWSDELSEILGEKLKRSEGRQMANSRP
jgi:pimeloyl-ACP methyl ester carboxylesterase